MKPVSHYSVDFFSDDAGWWSGQCQCGADLGAFPTAEDAADALMEHAFDAGFRAASSHDETCPTCGELASAGHRNASGECSDAIHSRAASSHAGREA